MDEVKLYDKRNSVDNQTSTKIKPWLVVIFYVLGLVSLLPWNFYMVSKNVCI